GRARDRAGELEAAQTGRTGAVETDGVRRPSAGEEPVTLDSDRSQLAVQPEDEGVDAVVGDEQVRSEADRRGWQAAFARPAERLRDLVDVCRPREGASRSASAEGRQPPDRDVLVDLHASASRRSGTARSTSPAPSVSTRSPARARRARKRAPSSTDGI